MKYIATRQTNNHGPTQTIGVVSLFPKRCGLNCHRAARADATSCLTRIAVILALIVVSGLFGCTSHLPYPLAARAGDTITLNVGSPDGMTHGNTVIEYVPDDTQYNPVVLHDESQGITDNLRTIANLYPDQASAVWLKNTLIRTLAQTGFHGVWLTVVVLDLPAGLPVGPGKIHVTTPAVYPNHFWAVSVNDVPISLEILPGQGTSHSFPYKLGVGSFGSSSLTLLETLGSIVVVPTYFTGPIGNYGAAEVKVKVPSLTAVPQATLDGKLRVIIDQEPGALITHLQTDWIQNGDEITVWFVSTPGLLHNHQLRFRIALTANNYAIDATGASVDSFRLFDENGAEITPPSELDPSLWRVEYDEFLS